MNESEREFKLKQEISRIVLVKEKIHKTDLIRLATKKLKISSLEVEKILLRLEFIGVVMSDSNDNYIYIAESSRRDNNGEYRAKYI